MKNTYTGGCQCGAVRFEATSDLTPLVACNCSRCGKIGAMLTFVEPSDFKLISGEGATTEYRFNKNIIQHLFCTTCGVESFARGKRPGDGADMYAINVRCLDGIDVDALTPHKFDGRSI